MNASVTTCCRTITIAALAMTAPSSASETLALDAANTTDAVAIVDGGIRRGVVVVNKIEAAITLDGGAIGVNGLRAHVSAFRTDGGDIYTCTPWTENVDGLLPRTDRIDFVKLVGEGESKPKVWPAKFEIAIEVCGRLMFRTGERPERWKTKGFPSEAELTLMTKRSGLEIATLTT